MALARLCKEYLLESKPSDLESKPSDLESKPSDLESKPSDLDDFALISKTSKSKGFEVLVFLKKKLKPRMDSKT
jgi:hypothetical protein